MRIACGKKTSYPTLKYAQRYMQNVVQQTGTCVCGGNSGPARQSDATRRSGWTNLWPCCAHTNARVVQFFVADGLTIKSLFANKTNYQYLYPWEHFVRQSKVSTLGTCLKVSCVRPVFFFAQATFVHVQKVAKNFLHRKFFFVPSKKVFFCM